MEITCERCGTVASEVMVTPEGASYRGGCRHFELQSVDGAVSAFYPRATAEAAQKNQLSGEGDSIVTNKMNIKHEAAT